MYRDPIAHSRSLLKQHINFLEIQNSQEFILEYMNLIGHFEFGLGLKPLTYSSDQSEWHKGKSQLSIDYWLLQWIQTYKWILESEIYNNDNIYLINYEHLCNDIFLYPKICELVQINNSKTGLPFICANNTYEVEKKEVNQSILNLSMDIYNDLLVKSFR